MKNKSFIIASLAIMMVINIGCNSAVVVKKLPVGTNSKDVFSPLSEINLKKGNNAAIDPILFNNVTDYGFMWWEDAIAKTSDYTFNIKTNKYAMSFDAEKLVLKGLGIVSNPPTETIALRESQRQSLTDLLPTTFNAAIQVNGQRYNAVGTPLIKHGNRAYDYYQTVETGKYFQRRFLKYVSYEEGAPERNVDHSGIEIASWPDRLLFMQRIKPSQNVNKGLLEVSLDFDNKYSTFLQEGEAGALVAEDGSGYVIMATPGATLFVNSNTSKVVIRTDENSWEAGSEQAVGLIIYPITSNVAKALTAIVDGEKGDLNITAQQLSPKSENLKVTYDKALGWYRVDILDNPTDRKGFVQSQVTIKNTDNIEKQIRFNFNRKNNRKLPGASIMLRDEHGYPIGIPVQVSKNWHGNRGTERHKGPWFRGLSMLTVPANSTTTFEVVTVNSHWGSLPAASTSQLCLIGWGGNQQWNQSAIGNGGETITYDTDRSLNQTSLADMRGSFLNDNAKFSPNIGGANFFSRFTAPDIEDGRKRTRTHYRRYSPNMTEVTYASASRDGTMDNEFTAIEYRSDDFARGLYRIRLDVREHTEFHDFIYFQMGANTYHQGYSNTLALGNKLGLVKQWKASHEESVYSTSKIEAKGELPWFSFHDSRGSTANRGFVIRSWNARINGIDNVPPFWAEHGTKGEGTSIINIVPPPNVSGFIPGDYIEAEIELFMQPQSEDGYYGTNKNLKDALKLTGNTWEMVYREVLGNDISVVPTQGTLESSYPIQVKALDDNTAQFEVTGGVGFVPLTITGLSDYKNPVLEESVNGQWVVIDQSVHGEDFWQANYWKGTWEITYNVDLDTVSDARTTRVFRFAIN